MAGNDFKKLGDSIKRGLGKAGDAAQKGLGKAGETAQKSWKDIEPRLRKGSAQVGRTASATFEELGTSLRKFADRVRDRSAGDPQDPPPDASAPADIVDADVEPDDRN